MLLYIYYVSYVYNMATLSSFPALVLGFERALLSLLHLWWPVLFLAILLSYIHLQRFICQSLLLEHQTALCSPSLMPTQTALSSLPTQTVLSLPAHLQDKVGRDVTSKNKT
jgi:hypothetical protein